jgi:hypothetical protein
MPNAKAICCAILGQPQVGLCRFMSTTAAMTSWAGPFGPGFFGTFDENSRRYFRVVSARVRGQIVGQLDHLVGRDGATAVEAILEGASHRHSGCDRRVGRARTPTHGRTTRLRLIRLNSRPGFSRSGGLGVTIRYMTHESWIAQALARACFGGRTRVWAVRYAVLGAVMWQVCCGAASSPIGRLDISLEDARLSAAVRTALLNDRELGVRRISVESHNAIVTLSGTVLSVHEAERAVMLARSRDGVRDVKSDLRVVR